MTMMPYIAQMTLTVKRNMSARRTKSRSWGRIFFKALTSVQGNVVIWDYSIFFGFTQRRSRCIISSRRKKEAEYAGDCFKQREGHGTRSEERRVGKGCRGRR